MENNKQTAVEWLLDILVEHGYFKKLPIAEYHKAKAMEKEQIEDAFHAGKWNGYEYAKGESEIKDAAVHYNETYGNEQRGK
jgi:hypothetical protein